MSTKKPNPYHIDFIKLTFGAWESDKNAKSQKQENEQDQQIIDQTDDLTNSDTEEKKEFETAQCHEVRLLFGQNKLRYESSIFHPRGNRGRIEIDFSTVTSIDFELEKSDSEAGYKVTVQLSSPALTYVGNQVSNSAKKASAVYENEQTDFSEDGQIKKCRTHSFIVDNLNRLKIMRQKMEENGFADAISAGLDQALLTAFFSEEEVEASFTRGKKKTAGASKKNPSKKRPAPANENDDTGNNNNDGTEEAGAGPSDPDAAPASAPRAVSMQARKPNPKAVPGLLDLMPLDAGPWLEKCVERWNLIAPFDPNVIEEQWESYYRERAALDWYTEANGLAVVWDDLYAIGKKEFIAPVWTEDFPKPPMYAYSNGSCEFAHHTVQAHVTSIGKALIEVISGCPQLTENDAEDDKNIAEKLAAGIYVLGGTPKWGANGDCETLTLQTRLYSPYGLATSVDFDLKWSKRERSNSLEHIVNCEFATRGPEDCQHLAPQKSACADKDDQDDEDGYTGSVSKLFSMTEAKSGYLKRTFATTGKLRAAEEALFGSKNLLSERKIFSLLMHAATSVEESCVTADLENISRVIRRKWKNFVDETGDVSDEDVDSDNESRKQNKKKKEKFNPSSAPLAGFGCIPFDGGDDSDESEEDEGW